MNVRISRYGRAAVTGNTFPAESAVAMGFTGVTGGGRARRVVALAPHGYDRGDGASLAHWRRPVALSEARRGVGGRV
ncbi:hypothetical protein MMON_48820 [Mycolicibacterium monacense]|uniref:Uncharacterized protein n=1 Tax=Mycolicibacterium monacense TaxID=85693 RepID=A0AAD1IZ09_MYCMB|nr:hypothetical protein MMON_48820 [Mycolicibacterium monacense]